MQKATERDIIMSLNATDMTYICKQYFYCKKIPLFVACEFLANVKNPKKLKEVYI